MKICGLQKTTLLDFPGYVAATVFLGGCNFRCPFCHNKDVVLPGNGAAPAISEQELFRFLEKRRGVLEGVCITGGEPTLYDDLEELIRQIRAMGFLIKLDTNGYRPQALGRLLSLKLLDYAAMDIKAAPTRYAYASGLDDLDINRITESIRLIQQSGIPYEFRTTTARELQSPDEFQAIGEWLEGSQAYYLQSYRDCSTLSGIHFTPYEKPELEEFARVLRRYVPNTQLRGVE